MLGSSGGPTSSPESATTATVMNAFPSPRRRGATRAGAPQGRAGARQRGGQRRGRNPPAGAPPATLVGARHPGPPGPDGTLSIWGGTTSGPRPGARPASSGASGWSLFGDASRGPARRHGRGHRRDAGRFPRLGDAQVRRPRLALAVTDGQSVALAGYVPGRPASWVPAEVWRTRTRRDPRALGGGAESGLFGAAGAAVAPEASSAPADVEILALRDADGGFDRLRVRARARPRLGGCCPSRASNWPRPRRRAPTERSSPSPPRRRGRGGARGPEGRGAHGR